MKPAPPVIMNFLVIRHILRGATANSARTACSIACATSRASTVAGELPWSARGGAGPYPDAPAPALRTIVTKSRMQWKRNAGASSVRFETPCVTPRRRDGLGPYFRRSLLQTKIVAYLRQPTCCRVGKAKKPPKGTRGLPAIAKLGWRRIAPREDRVWNTRWKCARCHCASAASAR